MKAAISKEALSKAGRALLVASAVAAAPATLPPTARAGELVFSGTLIGSPTYHRPSWDTPNTPAFNCSTCGFHAQSIWVGTGGTYTFAIESKNFAEPVNILYLNSFNPSTPLVNFVGPFSYATYQTGNMRSVSLQTGIEYIWVTSTNRGFTFNNCLAGCNFSTRVTGPGSISVPEPSAWAMMLIGFGGMGTVLRSRRGKLATI